MVIRANEASRNDLRESSWDLRGGGYLTFVEPDRTDTKFDATKLDTDLQSDAREAFTRRSLKASARRLRKSWSRDRCERH